MINTSNEYKEIISQGGRSIYADIKITLETGEVLEIPQSKIRGLVIEDDVSGKTSFDIGAAIINQITLKVDNTDSAYSDKEFDQAEISVKIGLQLSETVEWLNKGIFTADPGDESGDIITIKAYDNMRKFEYTYADSSLTYPATLNQIVRDACDMCGVSFVASTIADLDYVVKSRPTDETLTFREVLHLVGQIACCWFRCNAYGALVADFYDLDAYKEESESAFHDIRNLTSFTRSTEDVGITGVRVVQESDGGNVAYQSGEDGYVLAVENNPLIQGDSGQTVADLLGEKLIGLRFRKMSASHQSDPSIEAGDLVFVTDRKGVTYKTLLTGTTFQLGGIQKSACNAETPARKSVQRFSESTKAYVALQKSIRDEKTARETAVENLAKTLADSGGLYMTTEEMGDGSFIYYAHNKPTMEESDIVWLFTAEAIGISTDGGKTYPYGFTVTGEMITSILQTEGINADWINAGCLTVKNSAGTIVFQADIATGKVIINADSISVGGKAVATEEYAKELAEKATNLTVLLSNEYQGIPTDADGNYTTFPECLTSIQVLYGQVDITSQCSLSATTSAGITGTLSGTTYTVTGLATDSGWVDIKATYLGTLTATKRFTITKVKDGAAGPQGEAGKDGENGKDGADGVAARVYILEPSVNVIKRGQDNVPVPDEITFSAYYRDGSSASRTAYAGRFKLEWSTDGNSWETVYTSSANETSCRYELYTAIEDGSGNYIEDGSGNVIAAWYDEDTVMMRCTLYAAGGTTSALDMQTVAVVIDVAALTHEQIFNLLTNDGAWQGLFYENGRLYMNGEYMKFNGANIGGWDINETSINKDITAADGTIYRVRLQPPTEILPNKTWVLSCQKSTDGGTTFTGSFILYSDGSAAFGDTIIGSDGSITFGDKLSLLKDGTLLWTDTSSGDYPAQITRQSDGSMALAIGSVSTDMLLFKTIGGNEPYSGFLLGQDEDGTTRQLYFLNGVLCKVT